MNIEDPPSEAISWMKHTWKARLASNRSKMAEVPTYYYSQQRHVSSLVFLAATLFVITLCTLSGQVICQLQDPVIFISEPRNMTILEGDSVRFECDFEGSDSTPSWSINNSIYYYTNLPQIYSFNGQDFSLSIENVSLDLSGTYFECIVGQSKSAKGVLTVLRSQSQQPNNAVNVSHPETLGPSEDLELSTSTLPVTTSLINILVTTSLIVTDHFEEYQAKSSNLLLVALGIAMIAIVLCLLLLVLVVSVRSCTSYKKQIRANSVAITEMNDAYGVFTNKVVMNTNPAYEDLQLYRHE